MQRLADIDFASKVALVRADLNVPLDGTTITDDNRIQASLPSIKAILANGGSCVVMSHLGRPKEGAPDAALSLAPVATRLSELLDQPVELVELAAAQRPAAGTVILLENTRFNVGEKANDMQLAQQYAQLGDIFVMDAFASAHRAEASTAALASAAAQACPGLLLDKEISNLTRALQEPARPLLAIVGGAKISTKLTVLDSLARLADALIVGGGIANTFLAAQGCEVGKSLVEMDMLDTCRKLLDEHGDKLSLPTDVVVAESLDAASGRVCSTTDVTASEMILDAGPAAMEHFCSQVAHAGTLVWNGALGVFEKEAFANGTRTLATAIAASNGFSLAGGGETVAAAYLYGIQNRIDYMSTGGGAFLEFIEGKQLPGLQALQ